MKKMQWGVIITIPHMPAQWETCAFACVLVVVVAPAMTVAYRTNSIKIPKTTITTIHVYIYRYTQ